MKLGNRVVYNQNQTLTTLFIFVVGIFPVGQRAAAEVEPPPVPGTETRHVVKHGQEASLSDLSGHRRNINNATYNNRLLTCISLVTFSFRSIVPSRGDTIGTFSRVHSFLDNG